MDVTGFAAVLFPIFLVQFVGWATPGPNHLTILTAAVTAGRPAGVRAGLGIAAGAVSWALITVSGIAVIFELVPEIFLGLRLTGAAYLIYLGIGAIRSAQRGGVFRLEPDARSPATTAPFRTAYLIMMTNPKAVLFFGAILTSLVPADGSTWLLTAIVVQMGVTGAILNVSTGVFFSSPAVVRWFQNSSTVMSTILGLLFCGLGLFVLFDVLR